MNAFYVLQGPVSCNLRGVGMNGRGGAASSQGMTIRLCLDWRCIESCRGLRRKAPESEFLFLEM